MEVSGDKISRKKILPKKHGPRNVCIHYEDLAQVDGKKPDFYKIIPLGDV